MIVVRTGVQFEDGLARFEMIAVEQAGLLELGQHAVDGGQAHVHIVGQQDFINILGGQVADVAGLEDVQDFKARQRGFQAAGLQIGWIISHGGHSYSGWRLASP